MLSKRLNLTQLIQKNFGPELSYQEYLRDIPVARDVFYLPEEYYDVEKVERELQLNTLQLKMDRDSRNLMPEYRNLCETITKKVELIDPDYEYQPPYYHEFYCKGYPLLNEDERITKPLQQVNLHVTQ